MAFLFQACEPESESASEVEASISVTPDAVDFAREGADTTLTVTATKYWAVDEPLPVWITLDSEYGDGDKSGEKVTLQVPENDGPVRTAVLVFSCGTKTAEVNVRQAGIACAGVTANPESGSQVAAGTELVLSCETEGAVIMYTIGSGNIDTEYSEPIVINEDVTVRAYAKKEGYADGETSSFTYTVKAGSTAAEIRSFNEGVDVVLENAVVSCVCAQGFFAQDESGAVYCYSKTAPTVAKGDSVTVSGVTSAYSGMIQISEFTVEPLGTAEVVYPEAVEYTESDIAAFSEAAAYGYGKISVTLGSKSNAAGTCFGHNVNLYYDTSVSQPEIGTVISVEGYFYGAYNGKIYLYVTRCEVTAINSYVTAMASATLEVGKTTDLGAITNSTAAIQYSSSDNSVAGVSADGIVTAKAEGESVITVSVPAQGLYTAAETTCNITVVAAGSKVVEPVVLSFPDDNSDNNKTSAYNKSWTAKIGDCSWTISNFNNNNWSSWTYIKCGSKNADSIAEITTDNAFVDAVENVVLKLDAITSKNVRGIKLVVASDRAFENNVTEISVSNPAQGDNTITISNPAEGRYYKLVFDCIKSSNGIVAVKTVTYNFQNGGSETPDSGFSINPLEEVELD